jgi:hypothetical protein
MLSSAAGGHERVMCSSMAALAAVASPAQMAFEDPAVLVNALRDPGRRARPVVEAGGPGRPVDAGHDGAGQLLPEMSITVPWRSTSAATGVGRDAHRVHQP